MLKSDISRDKINACGITYAFRRHAETRTTFVRRREGGGGCNDVVNRKTIGEIGECDIFGYATVK